MTERGVAPSIALHGGAGNLARYKGSGRLEAAEAYLNKVIDDAHAAAANGASALDVVESIVVQLEDVGLFHAGKGSSPNTKGVTELDASIMDGATLQCGAVIGVTTLKNPIIAARSVMQHDSLAILFSAEAESFAREHGVDVIDASYFVPCDEIGAALNTDSTEQHGTVGAVARDIYGNYAAATSTGGVLRKTAGRVGDSPIIGAGTYAENNIAAISCTGIGEYFVRVAAAYQVIARMDLLGESVGAATGVVMHKIAQLGGTGGMIAIGQRGEVAMPFNTSGMYRAAIDAWGKRTVAIF